MPYSMSNLPEAMKGKSKKSKEIFIAKFNSVLKESGKEATAYSIAYSAVDKHEKKVKQLKKSQGAMPWHLKAALQLPVEIVKSANEELKQVTYVAMQEGFDAHNHYSSEDEVRKAKESFNKALISGKVLSNLFHISKTNTFEIIESYLIPCDVYINEKFVKKGTWLVTLQILDDGLWSLIKSGDINGVSIGALANVSDYDNE